MHLPARRRGRPPWKTAVFLTVRLAAFLRSIAVMAPEIILGRWLAFCVHPGAAWRVLPRSGRALIAVTYAAASYVASLSLLVLLS